MSKCTNLGQLYGPQSEKEEQTTLVNFKTIGQEFHFEVSVVYYIGQAHKAKETKQAKKIGINWRVMTE